jgi:hypothetical protein
MYRKITPRSCFKVKKINEGPDILPPETKLRQPFYLLFAEKTFSDENCTELPLMHRCRCDYGFVRDSGRSSGCVRDPHHDMAPEGPGAPANCPPGTLYKLSKVVEGRPSYGCSCQEAEISAA